MVTTRKETAVQGATEHTNDEITPISNTHHAWRDESAAGKYTDTPGFCYSALLEEVRKYDHILTLDRYVGVELGEDKRPLISIRTSPINPKM